MIDACVEYVNFVDKYVNDNADKEENMMRTDSHFMHRNFMEYKL